MSPACWLLLALALAPPTDPRCEWLPPGAVIADPCPEFSWLCPAQAACRVLVGSSTDAPSDLWDSGWVTSELPIVEHAGRPWPVGQAVHWRLEVRDRHGQTHRVGPFTATYQPATVARLYPTIRSFLNFDAELPVMVRDYDVTYSAAAKARRPAMQAFNYSLLATMVVPSAKWDQLRAFAAREGLDERAVEAMFLHYGADTKVRLHVGREAADRPLEERSIRGWDPANDRDGDGRVSDAEARTLANPQATARTPREARVPIYYWGPPADDYIMYPGHPVYQRYLATVYVPAQLAGHDGLYIDTTPPAPPGPAAGRVLHEYRAEAAKGWLRDMLMMLAAIKREHPRVPLVANGWLARPFVIDGTQWENWLELPTSASQVHAAVAAVRELDRRGKVQWVQYNPVALDDQPTFAPRLPVTPDRDQLYGLAAYLLAHGERTYYGYGRHPYGVYARWWPAATRADLGGPLGEWTEQVAAPATAAGPNLLRNGDFEEPPTAAEPLPGWLPAPPFEVISTGAHDGRHCLHLASRSLETNNICKQWLTLAPNTVYTLSGYLRTKDVDGGGAQLYPYDFAGASGGGLITVLGTTDWTRYDLVFRTGANPRGRINLRLFRATGEAWFDGLRLVAGNEAADVLFARRFERGLVLLRPPGGAGYGDDSARECRLEEPLRPVAADGRMGAARSAVRLRQGEAAVLVRP